MSRDDVLAVFARAEACEELRLREQQARERIERVFAMINRPIRDLTRPSAAPTGHASVGRTR